MRFTLIKDIKKDSAMKPILNGLLLFMFGYLIADLYVSSSTIGFSFAKIQSTLYGNMDEFLDPIAPSAFLEYIHSQIFFIMMILLTLSAVFARLVKHSALVIIFINSLMISALGMIITLGLSYFMSENFILIYIGLFFLWHTLAIYMVLHSLWSLNFAKSI